MFKRYKKLHAAGVLGINRRNSDYTLVYNPRRLYPLVDDKLITKKLAIQAGLAVPELYGVIEAEYQIRHQLPQILKKNPDAVIKPAKGSGGNGILVLCGRFKDRYREIDGTTIEEEEVAYHTSNILSGMYSLGGQPDKAIVEYRVHFDPLFEPISYQGVPDIRIIVFLGVPVMSMIRLPTRDSNGKANLHQGAVGVGIDLTTGTTLTGVWKDMIVTEHPDTGASVIGVKIPHWDKLLNLATGCYELTGLGYIGVDIVLDQFHGPLILELNARPGLNIQIANREGLNPRLDLVVNHWKELKRVDERVAFAKASFQSNLKMLP
jgi:alpha-L-glutamate ligase-like protein